MILMDLEGFNKSIHKFFSLAKRQMIGRLDQGFRCLWLLLVMLLLLLLLLTQDHD